MSLSLSSYTAEEKMLLWKCHPLAKEYAELETGMREGCKTGSSSNANNRKFIEWNPIPSGSDRNVTELYKRFHPAIVRDDKLFKINARNIDIFRTAFNMDPTVGDELMNAALCTCFISFHTNGSPSLFQPSINEVLIQLPQEMIQGMGSFYFTTECMSENVHQCTVGSRNQYHIAVTSIYRA